MKYYFEKDFLLTDHYDVYRENSPASYDLFDVECRFDPNSENYTLLKADHSQKTYDGRICFEEFADGSELYLYNEIVNGKDEVVYLFCQTGGCCSKIWFNGEIVWINESQKYSASKLSLRCGTNTVVCSFVPQVQDAFIICRFAKETELFTQNVPFCSDSVWYSFCANEILAVHSGLDCTQKNYFDLLAVNGNRADFPANGEITVEVSDFEGTVFRDKTRFNTKYRLNLHQFYHLKNIPQCYLNVKIFCEALGENVFQEFLVILNTSQKLLEYTVSLAKQAKDIPCAEFDRQNLYSRLERIPLCDEVESVRCLKEASVLASLILQQKSLLSVKRSSHIVWVYFKSKLDNRVIKMCCHIPKTYSADKKYPLFVFFHAVESHYAEDAHSISEDYIIVDISVRGKTAASYIAEAAIFEQLEWLCENLSANRDKIYLIGACNGASSVFGMVQKYPDLFAGAYVVGGDEHKDNVRNLENLYVAEVTSPIDFNYDKCCRRLQNLHNKDRYDVYEMQDMDMMVLQYTLHQRHVLQKLLTLSRERYPRKIYFKTFRNRNTRCFWLKINAIKTGCLFAEIEAEVTENTLHITAVGTDDLTLDFSKNDKLFFDKININGTVVTCSCREKLRLTSEGESFSLSQTSCEKPASAKGTGLLEVFFAPVRVLTSDPENSILLKVANNFSKPSTNGTDPEINIRYPIVSADRIDHSTNLIVIDNNSDSEFFKTMRAALPVKTGPSGYSYKDVEYSGSYCIMQIIRNPNNPQRYVLYINSNQPSLYSRCLFTRKIILPNYQSGTHPYLNNECLIFDGNKYYGIYELGDYITIIE